MTAEALFRSDPAYFYRRLPIIALEEVSLGHMGLCLAALAFCRETTLRSKFRGPRLAGYLGARLAATTKSRSACDLLSLVNAQRGHAAIEAEIAAFGTKDACRDARSKNAPLRTRAAALLRLDRLPIRNGDERSATLGEIGRELELPAQITQVLVAGNSTHGLNALLPLVYELAANRPLRIEAGGALPDAEFLDGVVLCSAADQHTWLGRAAIRQWISACPALSHFLEYHGVADRAESVIGMALFHIEGSRLHRRLTNDCLESLRRETECAEMTSFGLTPTSADGLYELMRRHLCVLNSIRRRQWRT